ncbi:MAG: orotidine 5'-phosphate decarboxylase [Candidatus Epulonipiscioides saccharophilum]|nr:MAG: orotidine 5'-phosphate decarboxylase [Epulopiscium sp. AS2M-Bin001]
MIDRLIEQIKVKQNPTVVGLDPTLEMIPDFLKEKCFKKWGKTPKAVGKMFYKFNKEIIDYSYDLIPAVKPQIAMYERYGIEGLKSYIKTIKYAKKKNLLVIGDIKRGDIFSTAEAYSAHINGTNIEGEIFDLWKEDAVTLNPYMGYDAIEPFMDACKNKDKGLFILVKTSNKSGEELQDLIVNGKPIYDYTADLVKNWGRSLIGKYGYSNIGAVVGATYKEQGEELRERMPQTFFLVPGYGAQGATANDISGYFDERGLGAIVNSSRGIIAAYKKQGDRDKDFAKASREAVIMMRDDLKNVIKL